MAEITAPAAPAASTPANSAETPNTNTENTELSADDQEAEADLDASDDSSDEPKEASEEKTAKKSTKADKKAEKAAEKRLKKLKLKVDGQEIDEEIDLDDEDRLIRELQMSKMGQKRAQQFAELDKQIKNFMQALGQDPFDALKQLGMNPDQLIDGYITKQLENAKKTPEQLAKEQLEQELQRLKAEREKEKEDLKQKELTRLQEQAFQQYDLQMEQTLLKSDLPKTPYTVKKMADYMLVALQAGKDVSPDDVVELVKEEMENDLKVMFASMPEEKVEALLGQEVLNKLRKNRIAKAKAAQQAVSKPKVQDIGKIKDDEKPKEKKTFRDFFGM